MKKRQIDSVHPSSLLLAEGAGVEPAGVFSSDSFRDCSACPCPTFRELAGALGFEPRMAGLESASLAFSLRPLTLKCIREDSNLQRSSLSHSFTGCCRAASASDAKIVLKLMKCGKFPIRKLMKA